jgi:hypothetical protein
LRASLAHDWRTIAFSAKTTYPRAERSNRGRFWSQNDSEAARAAMAGIMAASFLIALRRMEREVPQEVAQAPDLPAAPEATS